jgi:hypothetical protein
MCEKNQKFFLDLKDKNLVFYNPNNKDITIFVSVQKYKLINNTEILNNTLYINDTIIHYVDRVPEYEIIEKKYIYGIIYNIFDSIYNFNYCFSNL